MKVDFIIGALGGGGAERVMVLLSEIFIKKGNDVRIITFHNIEDFYELDERVQRIHMTYGKFPILKIRDTFNLTRFYSKKRNRPDVAISFLTTVNLISILACKFNGVPIIVSEHNNHLALENPKWLTKLTWKYLYRKANFVTVLTSFDVDFFKKRKAKVVVMPNPCSFPLLAETTTERENTILAVGHLNRHYQKGFDNLIQIIKPVLKKKPEWSLKIIGGGDQGKEFLLECMQKEQIQNGIEFMGYRNDVRAIMKNTSIFVLPSRFEGLPMVLLEAMSQGMACIAYDCITGPGDMIEDQENGLLIPDQDGEAMQNGLIKLIEDAELRAKLGANAQKSLDEYSHESIYSKWEKLLKEV